MDEAANKGPEHAKQALKVVRQGQRGDTFFIVAKGLVDVHRGVALLESNVVKQLGKGTYFGEAALITSAPRGASS